ncbi:hypothetical protein DdX_02149 [Ditylenchus destructor]|uniref:Uncharacterized protein n=1 Tax=Ditylenchus destructor TaxID=166010 RepID=A0AAD4R8U9_9BILA|nr:hypothetical protein DdX_02149 [Ditylenchus destructor]
MKFWVAVLSLLAVVVSHVMAYPQPMEINVDPALQEQLMGRLYRSMMAKRSPSIGLSLAEYMASPQGQDNFHFIPSGRRK